MLQRIWGGANRRDSPSSPSYKLLTILQCIAECQEPCLAVMPSTWRFLGWLASQRRQSRRTSLQNLEVQASKYVGHCFTSSMAQFWLHQLASPSRDPCPKPSHERRLSVGLDEEQRAKMARLAAPPLPAGQPGAMPPTSHNGYYNPRCAAMMRVGRNLLLKPSGMSTLLSTQWTDCICQKSWQCHSRLQNIQICLNIACSISACTVMLIPPSFGSNTS